MLEFKGKHDENAIYPIAIQYTWGGTTIRKATGLKCYQKDWNAKGNRSRGELRASYGQDWQSKNQWLNNLISHYDEAIRTYYEKNPNKLTITAIKAITNDKPIMRADGGRDFVDFALERLNYRYSRKKIGLSRYKNGESSLNVFREFLVSQKEGTYREDGIYVSEISTTLIDKLIEWRRKIKGNKDVTINHALTPIIQAVADATVQGLIKPEVNAHLQDMRINVKPELDDDEFDGKYLTAEQLEALIHEYKKTKEQRRKEYLEMFLFSFYACGLRVSDIITLQWHHIDFQKKELTKVQIKTRGRNTIPLRDEAIAILNKWRTKEPQNEYVFKLLPNDFKYSDTEALYKRRNSITQSINQSLIPVGEKMDLPFTLTMHVARHTFAMLALNQGMGLHCISRLLGHSSISTTEKNYARFLPTTLTDELESLKFDFPSIANQREGDAS